MSGNTENTCERLGRYTLSHQGTFQGRHICLAKDDKNKTFTCKRRTGAELNHIRRIEVAMGKRASRVLPISNVVNTGSVLTESYTFQDQIRGSLADLTSRKGPLPEVVAATIIRQVLACLGDCHTSGVIVKNLELDHFVIANSEDEQVFLHDLVDCDLPNIDHKAPITPFSSPEVILGSQQTVSSNIWSCGVMLYVLLSQHWPFHGTTKEQLLQSVCSGTYFTHPCWSRELKNLLQCMLAVEPQRRLAADQLLRHPWFRVCEGVELSHGADLRAASERLGEREK